MFLSTWGWSGLPFLSGKSLYRAGLKVLRKTWRGKMKAMGGICYVSCAWGVTIKTSRTHDRPCGQELCPLFMVMLFPINGKIPDNREI